MHLALHVVVVCIMDTATDTLFNHQSLAHVAKIQCSALLVHLLMLLNGSVVGISSFIIAVKRDKEALNGGSLLTSLGDLPQNLIAGFLVGLDTKVAIMCSAPTFRIN